MKKVLITSALTLVLSALTLSAHSDLRVINESFTGSAIEHLKSSYSSTVYICTGPYAKVYHSTLNCRGLSNCSGNIVETSESSTNRRACRICFY